MLVTDSVTDPQVIAKLAAGGVGILPTDTIYGIVASAADRQAVERLYDLKRREGKPGTVIAANQAQLVELGVDPQVIGEVAHLWPNPISVELLVDDNLDYLSQGTGHCAFRLVADPLLRDLLLATGPLLTSSANHPGEPSSLDVAQAQAYFGDQVDFYVDGGERRALPSTVVRYRSGHFTTLRPGPVTVDAGGQIV